MSRLARDGTAEPVSRDQSLRHAREQEDIIFPVQLTTSRIGNLTRLIHTLLYVLTIHTYIHTQEEGHTGFLIHLPSAVRASIFLARRIQPYLSLVDREVDFLCINDLIVLHSLGFFFFLFFFF